MIILGTNSIKDTGFDVANSCRFNSASNDHLNRTQTAGNRRKFTFSTWVKRCNPATRMALFLANRSGSNYDQLYLNESGYLEADFYHTGTQIFRYKTNALYRDPSAWYNIIMAVDTEHDTASSRVRIYVNGLEVTSFSTETNPSENVDTHVNENSIVAYIGSDYNSNEPDYYLAETVMLDGTQATPTDFGEFDEDSGIWKPIDVSGLTFGTNGFYLDYEDSSALGNDAAGSNNFTVNNLTAIDQSTDTCTNNFATLNPLQNLGSNITYSEGNLTITPGTSDYKTTASTIAVSSGKWYAEFKAVSGHNGSTDVSIGIVGADTFLASTGSKAMSAYTNAFSYGSGGLVKQYNNSTIRTDATYTNDNIIGIAVDMDNLKLYWSKDGAFQNSGDPTSGATGTGAVSITAGQPYYICATTISSGGVKVFSANFGSPPYSESGGETDGDGYGNFAHAVPSGYYSLNTKNLAEYG